MAVSTFSKAAAGTITDLETVTPLTSTSGVFNVDLTAGSAFSIDFTDSYFNTLGTKLGPAPTFLGSTSNTAANGTAVTFTLNSLQGGPTANYSVQQGDLIVAVAVIANNTPGTYLATAPIFSGSTYTWTELKAETVDTTGSYDQDYRIVYAFNTGQSATDVISVSSNGLSASSTSVMVFVFSNVHPTNPTGAFSLRKANGLGDTLLDWEPITVLNQNSSVLSIAGVSGTQGTTLASTNANSPWAYTASVSGNDTYDAGVFMGYYETQFNQNQTISALTDGLTWANIQSWFTYHLEIKADPEYLSGIGPDGTINIVGYPDGVQSFDFYYKNTNSTGQQYSILGGTGFTSPTVISTSPTSNYEVVTYSFLSGNEVPSVLVKPKIQKIVHITSTTTWVCPRDVDTIEILLCGGGGGGGYGTSGGGGGGGSAFYRPALTVTPSANYTITIGAGGAGGTAGASGSTSTFSETGGSSLLTATGGGGGGVTAVTRGGFGAGQGGLGGAGNTLTLPVYGAGAPGIFGFGGGGGGGLGNNGYLNPGANGGGVGSSQLLTQSAGLANTGSGGGGADTAAAGNGGSGVAIIKYWSSL